MSETEPETPAPSALDGWDEINVVGRFVPAPDVGPFANISEAQAAGYDVLNPVTGSYQVAVVVDGAPVVIVEEQAAHVRHLLDAAKAAVAAKAAAQ